MEDYEQELRNVKESVIEEIKLINRPKVIKLLPTRKFGVYSYWQKFVLFQPKKSWNKNAA